MGSDPIDVTFIVIGYNEAPSLGACLRSVQEAELGPGVSSELIYVDGGSGDDSIQVAEAAGVNLILGGEKRRKASENRNLGLASARGRYIQFIDGDMVLAPDWPKAAMEFLEVHPETAAVCGDLHEAGKGLFFKAFEIDWVPGEGVIRHCGGAAMYRREPLEAFGGFPNDLAYGEEPYLCWRIRNELNMTIYQLDRRMADHDLGYGGFWDYWRRNVRVGATYAEIAARCMGSHDRLWLKESVGNLVWGTLIAAVLIGIVLGPLWLKGALVLAGAAILARKWMQMVLRGHSLAVAMAYAVHTYFSKLPLALGELAWLLRRAANGLGQRFPLSRE